MLSVDKSTRFDEGGKKIVPCECRPWLPESDWSVPEALCSVQPVE